MEKAKEKGLQKLLVTCNEKNPASEKVILKCGGVYESTLPVEESRIKRYWIIL